ncbi:MAG: hypothetical protein PHF63_00890 [Herbinix sp.]|nr:hypothetical protein [Herbinix sp.]
MKEKLFVLSYNDNIIGICNNKDYLLYYIMARCLPISKVNIEKVRSDKKKDKILSKYLEFYIEEFHGYYVPSRDIKIIENMIKEERGLMKLTIESLRDYSNPMIYNITRKERKVLLEALDLLETKIKKKNINEFVDVETLVRENCLLDDMRLWNSLYIDKINRE